MTKKQTPTEIQQQLRGSFYAGKYRRPVRKSFSKASLTKQAFKEDVDINRIVSRYQDTGVIDHLREGGTHIDALRINTDYHDLLNQAAEIQQAFDLLPAQIRKKEFDNDPGAYLEFIHDPKNEARMVELGIIDAPQKASETSSDSVPAGAGTPPPAESEDLSTDPAPQSS